jgi:uncharacterized repeat protein (TIGR03803 family)
MQSMRETVLRTQVMELFRVGIAVALACMLHGAKGGPILTSLHSFSVYPDGARPEAPLLQASDGNFYGTTSGGGTNGGNGAIFRITPKGALSGLYSFSGGSDGANPMGGLIQGADGYLYGTAANGGGEDLGTIFRISTNGVFRVLYSFQGTDDSSSPAAPLLQASDGNFYGTTEGGADSGGIFRITPGGVFTNLYLFTGNGDGATPMAGLAEGPDGELYGTTEYGGDTNDFGTIFQISTNGAFSTVYVFGGGSDSANPVSSLLLATDGNFYGTTSGYTDNGIIFQFTTGLSFTPLYWFTGGSDGGTPMAGLVQGTNGNLYGTTEAGGTADGYGTLFEATLSGTLTTLHLFAGGQDGAYPMAGLIQARDGNLYGTASEGNTNGAGTVFKTSPQGAYMTWCALPGVNDGGNPSADLTRGSDGHFYGTTEGGGDFGDGVVFGFTTNGVITLLYEFGEAGDSDGGGAEGVLVQGGGGIFYSTTADGGENDCGTVYALGTNGDYSILYSFGSIVDNQGTPLDGSTPWAGLVRGADGSYYGTTCNGGQSDDGTVYQVTTNGLLTTLQMFDGDNGANPYCTLIQCADGNLYGTCSAGGDYQYGTVFQISTNGAFNNLYSFSGAQDGAGPEAGLVQGSDGWLYGTTTGGGTAGCGTVFKISTDGTFAVLAQFDGTNGAAPEAPLTKGLDGNFYGTASSGANGEGTLFQVTPAGVLTVLWQFSGGGDGANPDDALIPAGNGVFYGMAENGGAGGMGTFFRLVLAPALRKPSQSGGSITIPWDAVVGLKYQVQYKTNLNSSTWANLGGCVLATNTVMQVSEPAGAGPRCFYRVALVP